MKRDVSTGAAIASLAVAAASALGFGATLVGELGGSSEILIAAAAAATAAGIGWGSKRIASVADRALGGTHVFISYGHADQTSAMQIADELSGAGARTWLDAHEIQPGDEIESEIARGMRHSDVLVVLASGDPSPFVEKEVAMAKELGLRIIPVLLSGDRLPNSVSDYQGVDLRTDREGGILALVGAVMHRASR